MLRFFSRFLTQRYMRVIANGRISEIRKVLSGTPQGSGLSPLLFALFIWSLAVLLEEQKEKEMGSEEEERREEELRKRGRSSRTNIEGYLFADDLKLLASPFQEADMKGLQKWLNLAYGWAKEHGMLFSFAKTSCVRVGRIGMCEEKYQGDNNEENEFEDEVRDLGIWFSS